MATDRSESGVQSVTVRAVRASDVSRVWGMIGQLAEYERMTDILTGTPERLAELLFHDPPALFGLVAERADGRLDFGPWERIFYGEFDGRRKKRVLIKVIGE